MKILLAGCGDIAIRLANNLTPPDQCFGLRRNPENLPKHITPVRGDITDAGNLQDQLSRGFDVVVVTLTPDNTATVSREERYRRTYVEGARSLHRAIERSAHPPQLVVWVSSSSVYGQTEGEWVDEESPALPNTASGRRLLQAETEIRKLSCPAVIVRFSGIYGPGRTGLIRQIAAGEGWPPEPERWSNRIHSEDCAGVLAHLIKSFKAGEKLHSLYLASDCEPVTQHRLRSWLAQQMGISLDDTSETKGTRQPNRRCANRRLLDSGYRFIYPDYRQGYLPLINKQQ